MLIGKRCTICHDSIDTDNHIVCDECGNALHEQCADYQRTYECSKCAEEPEIGALEF